MHFWFIPKDYPNVWSRFLLLVFNLIFVPNVIFLSNTIWKSTTTIFHLPPPPKIEGRGSCVKLLCVNQLFEIWELRSQIRHWNGSMVHKSIIARLSSFGQSNSCAHGMALISMLVAKGKLLSSHQNVFGCNFFSPSMSLPWWKKMFSWQLNRLRVEENSFKEQTFKTSSSCCKLMECSVSGYRTRINLGTGRNKQKNPKLFRVCILSHKPPVLLQSLVYIIISYIGLHCEV